MGRIPKAEGVWFGVKATAHLGERENGQFVTKEESAAQKCGFFGIFWGRSGDVISFNTPWACSFFGGLRGAENADRDSPARPGKVETKAIASSPQSKHNQILKEAKVPLDKPAFE